MAEPKPGKKTAAAKNVPGYSADEIGDGKIPPKSKKVARYALIVFQTGGDSIGDFDPVFFHVATGYLNDVVTTAPQDTEIDVWLDSGGGSATTAYKLFLDLRSRCRHLRVIVPDYAKSAATLFAIGADEIFMAPAAELGPLDAQIEHPDREGVMVSALEVAGGFDFLGRFASNYAVSGGAEVLHWTGLPRAEVLREFLRFSAKFLKPAISKLDPHLVYRAANQLDLAQRYAEAILHSRNKSDTGVEPELNVGSFVHHLVRHYPIHEFAISRDEARAQGLPVRDAVTYDYWPQAQKCHRKFRDQLFSRDSESVVVVLTEKQIKATTIDLGNAGRPGIEVAENTQESDAHNGSDKNATHARAEKVRQPRQEMPDIEPVER